jgi:subtilisin-like proprotein convertase family protein
MACGGLSGKVPEVDVRARFSTMSKALVVAALTALLAAWAASPAVAQVVAGHEVPYAAESPHPYPTGTGATPSWSNRVHHPEATYIAIHFERFDLGPGDRVVIRSDSGRQRHVLTERGRHNLGRFWAPHIKGDSAVIELFSPGRNDGAWGVAIDSYVAGVVDLGSEDGGQEAVCGTDDRFNAVCYEATEAASYDQSRAVARLLINGAYLCTGWLVGCEGHFMTNNHCIDTPNLGVDPATAVLNTDYEFNAEAPLCGSPNGQLMWPGTIWAGAPTLVDRNVGLDYAFIHLADNPQNSFGAFSIDNRAPIANERIYIPQHPAGRAKEIALQSTDPTDESGFCEVTDPQSAIKCTGGGPGDVTYQCDGQGGSSGSPVVSYDNQAVIALHHCSLLSGQTPICPNLGVAITAIVSDLGANLPQCAIVDPVVELTFQTHTVHDDLFGNNNSVAEPFEIVFLEVDLHNTGNVAATNVSAVLSTTTPGITILDNGATWPTVEALAVRTSESPHFQVQIDPSVPCGTLIDFDLAVASDQGPFNLSFQVQVGATPGGSGSYPSVDTPLPIPDNSPAGVISTAPVADFFTVGLIKVSVDISHTRIGDLQVDLISPAGTMVRLHNESGGNGDDIITTYDTLTAPDGPGSMSDFLGESVNGNWQLKVVDVRNNETGTINSWTLDVAQSTSVVCDPVPCEVTAAAEAIPDTVCEGDSLLLADAGSTQFGEDCSGTLEYQFKLFAQLLQDWSTDPDLQVTPASTTTYTVRVRDQGTQAEDLFVVPVTVVSPPVAGATQSPDPMCTDLPGADLDAGPGFAGYTWRDDQSQVVGNAQILPVDATACGRTYTIEVSNAGGCSNVANVEVRCETCTPPEVSPAGAPVPLRMDVDGLGTMEFELLADAGVLYHLYHSSDVGSFLAGDWSSKFCNLALETTGTWTPVNATTVRWTPTFAAFILEGYWVVMAENATLEGPYGVMSGGAARPADTDATGSTVNLGCP